MIIIYEIIEVMNDSIPAQSTTITNQDKPRFLTIIIPFLILSCSSLLLLVFLDSFFQGINQARFTPREGSSIGFSYPISVLIGFAPWLIGLLSAGSLITYFISRSLILSKVVLILAVALSGSVGLLAYWVSRQPCEGLGCIGISITLLFAEAVWVVAAGTISTLFLNIAGKIANPVRNRNYWLIGFLTLLSISLLWFFATSHLRAESAKEVTQSKNEIQQIYSDPSFPVYEPSYLPTQVGKVGHEGTVDRGDSTEYFRWYGYGPTKVTNFHLIETRPKEFKESQIYLQSDFDKLKMEDTSNEELDKQWQQQFPDIRIRSKSNPEILAINSSPAIYFLRYGKDPTLYVYKENVRIEINVNTASEQLPKEELIQIAQSLKRVN